MSTHSRVSRDGRARRRRPTSSAAGLWFLAFATPALSAVMAWLWFGLVISASACAGTFAGGSLQRLGVPILLSPAVVALLGWRSRAPAAVALGAVIVSALLALVVVRLELILWWSVSGCQR